MIVFPCNLGKFSCSNVNFLMLEVIFMSFTDVVYLVGYIGKVSLRPSLFIHVQSLH